ncbi:MAG: exodeoxyribonuclease VII large subunit [Bacteroidales bacterium]|nr:exodeoxyribonuclease VII large subunit [Bacteroidales bacterium]
MEFYDETYSVYSLSKLAESLRMAIYRSFPEQVWVQAEIAKKNVYPRSGHVYLDLVEKSGGTTLAQMRGIIWANDYPAIQHNFEKVTGEPFREGLKILFLARFNFHATFGLSLWISEVEPSFTLGELSKVKGQTISRLHQENLFDLNKYLPIPSLPLRIAVISSETSKGYLDFIQVIRQHAIPYRFEITLFPALLQGDKAVASMREQLKIIGWTKDEGRGTRDEVGAGSEPSPTLHQMPIAGCQLPTVFDLVAIIRGGGDEIGLTCFDNYELAKDICTFPLPVVTGIGHSTNETVVEMVAALNRITPTEVAYDLLARLDSAYDQLIGSESTLGLLSKRILSGKTEQLFRYTEKLHSITHMFIGRQRGDLEHRGKTLRMLLTHLFSSRKSLLAGMESQVRSLDPKQVLKRGYSMTYDPHGRILKDASAVKAGDKILTELAKGTLKSTVDP